MAVKDGERVGFGQAAILGTTAGSRAHSLAQFGRQARSTHEAAPSALSLKAALALATRIRCSTRMISSSRSCQPQKNAETLKFDEQPNRGGGKLLRPISKLG
jgi:hypothetical protein